jgi:anti-sigma regulatory factor (Ser/Thr protein kinase)
VGFSEAECRAVVLAVDEALTNIIRHAYLGNTEQPIKVAFYKIPAARDGHRKEALEIVLEDRGKAVNHKKMCGRALEDVRPGGLGLHFIRECMDTVEFQRKIGRNQLRLVKILDVHRPEKSA